MSIFTSFVSKQLDVPSDPGATITIRKLSPTALQRARDAGRERANVEMKFQRESMGEAEFRQFKADIVEQLSQVGGIRIADPLSQFDRLALISAGVTAWSYDMPRDDTSFEQIEDDTQDWLAGEILRLSKPSLYQAAAEAQADQKND